MWAVGGPRMFKALLNANSLLSRKRDVVVVSFGTQKQVLGETSANHGCDAPGTEGRHCDFLICRQDYKYHETQQLGEKTQVQSRSPVSCFPILKSHLNVLDSRPAAGQKDDSMCILPMNRNHSYFKS